MKTRLTQTMRDALITHARSFITPIINKKHGLDEAKKSLERVLLNKIEEQYPTKDMKIIRKYGQARGVSEAKVINLETRGCFEFRMTKEFDAPDRYDAKNIGLEPCEQMATYEKSAKAVKDELEARISDYKSLIFGSRNVEDVIAVWPEAKKAISPLAQFKSYLPLDPKAEARIQEDLKACKK